ncbi:protein FAM216A-like [Carassius auratus]|uniref:Protein FAM216A-like n=1 Tax=Carassius auratus TaxID=7957 RepID=A0A6P6M3W8_CARAU|nr:protein FAM216A-like [Carassius auratus]XP_026098936.1 protein FAM216A-like [Carassius auratus]
MKKHVKFLESNDKSRLYHRKSFLPLRPSGLSHVHAGKTNSVFGHKIQKPATVQVPEQDRGTKTIHIPKIMAAAPFLQHPGLTPGQKRFLYNFAEAYSKEHMRQLICQHYMNVLHRCIRTVPDANVHLNVKLQMSTRIPQVKHTTNSQITSTSRTKESGKRSSTSEKVKKTTLPKLVNHQRVSSGFAKPNTIHSTKRTKTKTAKHASSRESRPWEDDFECEATEMDSYLAGHISGLSFNESEDDDEYYLFLT